MIEFNGVYKKYYLHSVFHRSLREDIVNFFRKNTDESLKRNEFWALQGVSFKVKKGECVGLYGPNGAGKSTILKLIANVTYPTKGKVTVKGRVAPLIEIGAGFHHDLTGRENIFVNGAILGMRISEIKKKIEYIVDFSELEEFIDMPVRKYSSGMYFRLGFSIAIHSDSDIYLIDEVMAVADANFRSKCINRMLKLKGDGKTILLVSHDTELLKRVTDRVIRINKGRTE